MNPYTDPSVKPALDAYLQMVMAHSGNGPVMTPAEKVAACAAICEAPALYLEHFMTRLVLMHDAAALEQYDAACKVAWITTIVEHGGDARTIDMLERANWRVVTGRDPSPAPEG